MGGDFLNNPLIGAMAGAFMLHDPSGPVAAVASQLQPSAPPAPVAKPGKSGAETPREFRHTAPLVRGNAGARGLTPGQNSGSNMPGTMSPDMLMHPEVQKLLNQYGVSPEQATSAAQNASPNLFITNPAAYQKHPMLSGMLEGAMEGAAFTHGSSTIGEGISNVAQGLLAAKSARAEKYNNQLMMPFAQAQTVANLQTTAAHQAFEDASTRRYNSMADYNEQRPDLQLELARTKAQGSKDLQDQKDKTARFRVAADPRFNYADQGVLAALIAKHGHLADVPEDELEPVLALGAKNKAAADTKNKVIVQNAANQGKTAAAAIGASGRGTVGDKAELADTKDEAKYWVDLQKEFNAAFSRSEFAPGYDANGNQVIVTPGDTDAANASRGYFKKMYDAAVVKKQGVIQGLKTPGSGMTPPKASKTNHNPAPVGYHDPASGKTKQADGSWK